MNDPAERDGFARLSALAREAADAPPAARADDTGRRRLIVETEQYTPTRGWSMPRVLVFGAGALALVAALGFYVHWQTLPLTYAVYGGTQLAANYVETHQDESARVKFSDGTEIDAQPGSRLRIDATHNDGARVFVERGSASARVKHRSRSRWVFVAGPFDVRVIGTKFKLDWDPVTQTVSLALYAGAVEVESPVGQSHCVVRAGQRFRASLPTGTMTLENIDGPRSEPVGSSRAARRSQPESVPSVVPEPVESPRESRASRRAEASPAEARAPKSHWNALVRRGSFQEVVDAALAGDLDATLASCSAADARALADAARYTKRSELAERALQAIRARFPDTRHSAAAAFLLGRTSESSGEFGRADGWYKRYASEAPGGEFAADALAGRIRCVNALSGAEAAGPLAREYLQRFPEGVHVEAARRLAGQH